MFQEHLSPFLHPLQDLPNLPLNHMVPSYWTASCSIYLPPLLLPLWDLPTILKKPEHSVNEMQKNYDWTFTQKILHLFVLQQLASSCLFILWLINNTFILCTDIMACLLNLLEPTGQVMHQQVWHSTTVHSAHTVFRCLVWISEQTATCATYKLIGFLKLRWKVFTAQYELGL